MLTLATVTDLEARLGRQFSDEELPRVHALLDDASHLVRDVAGRACIPDDLADLTQVSGSVRAVVARMVERAIRNPEGFSAESAGDYSYQRTGVQPGVYLTEAEERAIRRACGRTGLWTQPVTRNEYASDTIWVNDQFGTEPIPWETYDPTFDDV
jgi:hypothetical protein